MFNIIGPTLLYIMFTCSGLPLLSAFVPGYRVEDEDSLVVPTTETDVEWGPENESDLTGELGTYKRHMGVYNFDDSTEPNKNQRLSLAIRASNKNNSDTELDSEAVDHKTQKNFDRYAETKNCNDTLEGLRDFEKRYDCSRGCHFKKPDIVFRIKALPTRCEKKKLHTTTGSPFSYKSACVVHNFNDSEIEDEISKVPIDVIHDQKFTGRGKNYRDRYLSQIYGADDTKGDVSSDNQSGEYAEGKSAKQKYKEEPPAPYVYQFMNDSHLKLA